MKMTKKLKQMEIKETEEADEGNIICDNSFYSCYYTNYVFVIK